MPAGPVAVPTVAPPVETVTRVWWPLVPAPRTVTLSRLFTGSGTMSRRVMWAAAVGSSHTVCQMPEAAV